MDYTVRRISGDRYQINIVTQSTEELKMIQNTSKEYMETYYHDAVEKKLGKQASLLSIVDDSLYPFSVIGIIKQVRGIGNY